MTLLKGSNKGVGWETSSVGFERGSRIILPESPRLQGVITKLFVRFFRRDSFL
jgi:hypothetical protein